MALTLSFFALFFWAAALAGMWTATSVLVSRAHVASVTTIFNSADAAVITKYDLTAAVEFDEITALANIQAVRPGMPVFLVSAKTGKGMDNYLRFLTGRLRSRASGSAKEAVSLAAVHLGASN